MIRSTAPLYTIGLPSLKSCVLPFLRTTLATPEFSILRFQFMKVNRGRCRNRRDTEILTLWARRSNLGRREKEGVTEAGGKLKHTEHHHRRAFLSCSLGG